MGYFFAILLFFTFFAILCIFFLFCATVRNFFYFLLFFVFLGNFSAITTAKLNFICSNSPLGILTEIRRYLLSITAWLMP